MGGLIALSVHQDAAHCFEELILLEPRNHAYHAHLAEAYFSTGASQCMFQVSLQLTPYYQAAQRTC